MKNVKKFVIMIGSVLLIAVGVIIVSTLKGDGITVDSLKHSGQAEQLIAYITTGKYTEASQLLVCDGEKDVDSARAAWAEGMAGLELEITQEAHTALTADDGISKTRVTAWLADGKSLNYTVAVQKGGLGILAVSVSNETDNQNPELTQKYAKVMTSWNAG